ncbi:hypothetical protein SUDANB120_05310 [Streptomyces sp. enrichment culture]
MNRPNCASDMESSAYGIRAGKKVTHTCSECGNRQTR